MHPAGDPHGLADVGGQVGGQDALHGGYLLDQSQRDPREVWASGNLAVPPHLRPRRGGGLVRRLFTGASRAGSTGHADPQPFFPQLGRVFAPRRQTASQQPAALCTGGSGRYSAPSSLLPGTLAPAPAACNGAFSGPPVSGVTTTRGVTPVARRASTAAVGRRLGFVTIEHSAPTTGQAARTATVAPEGRRLLRIEARNAETPIERKPPWIKVKAKMGPEYTAAARAGLARGAAHRLPGGRLPQHLRVLGGPGGHLPHRWRPVHPALRLLPDRHRQAGRVRRRRAAPGRRVGGHDGPAVRHHHRRGPGRPARRRRVALRRDRPADPRPAAGLRRRAADPRLQRGPRAARRGLRRPAGGARAQRRDGAADLQADPARRSATSARWT